jgi:hypothetical protein
VDVENADGATLALLALGLPLVASQLWRAVLFVRPESVRIEIDDPNANVALPEAILPLWQGLQKLGFELLGSHIEQPKFGRRVMFFDAVCPAQNVFAVMSGAGADQRLTLMTPLPKGGLLITANFRRPAREIPGVYLSGCLEGAAQDRLLNAHLRRARAFTIPQLESSLDGCVNAISMWYRRHGKFELRQQHAVGLLWTLAGLGMVGGAVWGVLR